MRYLAGLVLTLFLMPSMGAADTLYKWVDAQGNVHYSDKPAPGATKINVPKAPTFTPPQAAAPVTTDGHAGAQVAPDGHDAGVVYTAIKISTPEDQGTLWNTTQVTVTVALTPGLQAGDKVTIAVDGNSQVVQGTTASFDNLDRGQHTATAAVTNKGGTTLAAKGITFYIQRGIQKHPP